MDILLITLAGTSTRFSNSIGRACHKSLYFERDFTDSLLYKQVTMCPDFDRIVLVGGFMFEELRAGLDNLPPDVRSKIVLIHNERFSDLGSGYSLYLGLKAALEIGFDQLVFMEGDLWVRSDEFMSVVKSDSDVITVNSEDILAKKAVALYTDTDDGIHYIYDTNHSRLRIEGDFTGIYNSGQVWKFIDMSRVTSILNSMSLEEWGGTNLRFIQHYFDSKTFKDIHIVKFSEWINCNTVEDYYRIPEVR